jgi:hypothetical protein
LFSSGIFNTEFATQSLLYQEFLASRCFPCDPEIFAPTWILPTYDDPIVPQRAAYEQQMPELPNRRVYVKAAAKPPPPPPLPTTYYRLYPKVQTVTDGPSVRTVVEEPRDQVVEAGVPVVSQDAVRRESQLPPPPPLKNLPIELKVSLCCEKCEKKVYDKLMNLSENPYTASGSNASELF